MNNKIFFQDAGFQGTPRMLCLHFSEDKIYWKQGFGSSEVISASCDQIKVRNVYPVFQAIMILCSSFFLIFSAIYLLYSSGLADPHRDIRIFNETISPSGKLAAAYLSFSPVYFVWSCRLIGMNRNGVFIRFISHPPRKTIAYISSPIFVCYSNFEGATSDQLVDKVEDWAKCNGISFIDNRKRTTRGQAISVDCE